MAQKKRAQWSVEDLEAAMDAVQNGMATYRAATTFNIPRRTLRNHLDSGSTCKRLGRPPVLTDAQEDELVRRIGRLCDVGMPLTPKILRKNVYAFVKEAAIKHPFSIRKEIAGKKWMKLFFARHPDIAKRRAQKLNLARAQKLNRAVVHDYFEKLRKVLTEKGFKGKPSQIYNMDEKGCQLTLHHQQSVLANRGTKRVHIVAPEHGENVSIVACGNALGQSIPPLIIMKGQRIKPEWYYNLPPESKILMTKKGSMTVDAFIEWIDHFSRFKSPGPCLLVFDGASSHLDIRIVEAADRQGITLFCLPSNTTHELQPLDKAVFRSFEAYWDEEVLNFWVNHNNERSINRARFGQIFSPVWLKSMSPDNICSGFRATGIWPFNPNVIPDTAFAPSCLTQRAAEITDRILQETTVREIEANVSNNGNVFEEHHVDPSCSSSSDIINTKYQQFTTNQTKKMEKRKHNKIFKAKISDTDSDSSGSYMSDTNSSDDLSDKIYGSDGDYERKAPEKRDKGKENKTENIDISFTDTGLLTTPVLKISTKKRRQAINAKAQEVTRDLFGEPSNSSAKYKKNQQSKSNLPKANQKQKTKGNGKAVNKKCDNTKESWYCFLCTEDRVYDMRKCVLCHKYVHEDCVGLTKNDKEAFVCPHCS